MPEHPPIRHDPPAEPSRERRPVVIPPDLFRLAQAGDAEAYHQAVALIHKRLLASLGSNFHKYHYAVADKVQEAILKTQAKVSSITAPEKLYSYLYTTASRLMLNHIRDTKKHETLLKQQFDANDSGTGIHHSEHDALLPDEYAASLEELGIVEEVMQAVLSEDQRLVIQLTGLRYTKAEIAEQMGIPENTVSTKLFRARAKLRNGMAERLDLSENEVYRPQPKRKTKPSK